MHTEGWSSFTWPGGQGVHLPLSQVSWGWFDAGTSNTVCLMLGEVLPVG